MTVAYPQRVHRKPSESVIYHAIWVLDLARRDGTRCQGRAQLQFAFSQTELADDRVEGLVWGRLQIDGVTATIDRGRSVLQRSQGRSHLRIDLPFQDVFGQELTLRTWCEGPLRQPAGEESGHVLLCGPDDEVLASGTLVLHMRVILEQFSQATPAL